MPQSNGIVSLERRKRAKMKKCIDAIRFMSKTFQRIFFIALDDALALKRMALKPFAFPFKYLILNELLIHLAAIAPLTMAFIDTQAPCALIPCERFLAEYKLISGRNDDGQTHFSTLHSFHPHIFSVCLSVVFNCDSCFYCVLTSTS